ncbi:unnamed protein product, partial [Ixodes pacificus]
WIGGGGGRYGRGRLSKRERQRNTGNSTAIPPTSSTILGTAVRPSVVPFSTTDFHRLLSRPLPVGFAGGLAKLVRHSVSPSPLPRKVSPVARRTWRRGRRRVRSCSVWWINTVRRRSGIPLARRRPIVPDSAMRAHPRGPTTPPWP